MSHEIITSFRNHKLPLRKSLVEMLDEHFSHCTERRGCGFTQSTRFLSDYINSAPDVNSASDLRIFSDWRLRLIEEASVVLQKSGWSCGWRNIHKAPESTLKRIRSHSAFADLNTLMPRIETIKKELSHTESHLFVSLVQGLLSRSAEGMPCIKGMPVKPKIGSCSQAEEFFLEIAHNRIRRGGHVNIIANSDGTPVLVEKINLGESHSAIVVSPFQIYGIEIPVGSLCALKYSQPTSSHTGCPRGRVIPIADIQEARFLRLTTLAVPPADRPRAFSQQLSAQIQSQMLSPGSTTIEQLNQFALRKYSESQI